MTLREEEKTIEISQQAKRLVSLGDAVEPTRAVSTFIR